MAKPEACQMLSDAVRAIVRRHSSTASAVNANLAPISATTKQYVTQPDYFGCVKACSKVLAYILCVLIVMFSGLVLYTMVAME